MSILLKLLEVKGIFKTYAGNYKPAVSGLAFSMLEGEIISFVGPSGSGKSTLLKLIGGFIGFDDGEIYFDNEPLDNPDDQLIPGQKGIRMVFQDLHLMPNRTVEENVRYPLLLFDKPYQDEKVEELLVLCRLSDFRNRFPKSLSGGQQQRLALAHTLASEPQLLLMDEPFSSLDPVLKQELLIEVSGIIKQQGLSLIMVTHDTRDALMISDKIGFIQEGRLFQYGTPKQLYNQPENTEIARFFGPVNLLDQNAFAQVFGKEAPFGLDESEIYGIRAEAFSKSAGDYQIKGELKSIFYLGHLSLCRIFCKQVELKVLLPSLHLKKGSITLFVFQNTIMRIQKA